MSHQAKPQAYTHEIIMVLNYLDTIAIGIKQDLYDGQLAKDHMKPIVQMYRSRYLSSEEFGKHSDLSVDNYSCLMKLCDEWLSNEPQFKAS